MTTIDKDEKAMYILRHEGNRTIMAIMDKLKIDRYEFDELYDYALENRERLMTLISKSRFPENIPENDGKGKYYQHNNPAKVICLENGKIFDSISSAAAQLMINPSGISSCCVGRQNTAGGLHWEYLDESKRPVRKPPAPPRTGLRCNVKTAKQYLDGVLIAEYPTAKDAAEALGIRYGSFMANIYRGRKNNGYDFVLERKDTNV